MKSHHRHFLTLILLVGGVFAFALPCVLAQSQSAESQTNPPASDGTVSLIIPSDPEPTWRASFFTIAEQANPAISGHYADPDGDGLSNIMERLLALNPRVKNSGYPFPAIASNGALSLAFFRLQSASDLDPMVEFSSDLVHWNVGDQFTFTNPAHTVSLPGYDSWEETSKFTMSQKPRQFMRTHVVRPSRKNFEDALGRIVSNNDLNQNDKPVQVMQDCVINNAGKFNGALTVIPHNRYTWFPEYQINWYFANVGLTPFVDTHKDIVKNYMNRFIDCLKSDNTIRDYLVSSDLDTINQEIASDSDDSYAGTFLGLAARFELKYHGTDSWFSDHRLRLKALATANLNTQLKPDGLVRTFQNEYSPWYIDAKGNTVRKYGPFGYLEDNVEVWADLQLFAQALESAGDHAGAIEYQTFCDNLRTAIHTVLWDESNKAWRVSDNPAVPSAQAIYYYADLQCQMFPQLYGLTHPAGEAEMHRRYDGAWAWLESSFLALHNPSYEWWKFNGWEPHPDPLYPLDSSKTISYPYSDLALAVVAARRGELEHSRAYMATAIRRWAIDPGRASGTTIISEIGYWQTLLKRDFLP